METWLKQIDPHDLRCAICNMKLKQDDIVAVVDLPNGKGGIVHVKHHGVSRLITNIVQITTGGVLQAIAYGVLEKINPEEAFAVLERENNRAH